MPDNIYTEKEKYLGSSSIDEYYRKLLLLNGKLSWFDKYGGVIPGALSFAGNVANSFTYGDTQDDLLRNAGMSYGNLGGYAYRILNGVNESEEMANVHRQNVSNTLGNMASGAAAGSVFGLPGAAIGAGVGLLAGLFGGGDRHAEAREKIRKANMIAEGRTMANRSEKASQMLQDNFYNTYGNTYDQFLVAENGKDAGTKTTGGKMKLTQTANGYLFAPHNGIASGGELIGNPSTGDWHEIRGGYENVPVYARNSDVILNHELSEIGRPHAEAIEQINARQEELDNKVASIKGKSAKAVALNVAAAEKSRLDAQKELHNEFLNYLADGLKWMRDLGIYPQEQVFHAWNGLDRGNLIAGVTGGLVGLGQYFGAKNLKVKSPSTYMPNTFAGKALALAAKAAPRSTLILNEIDQQDTNNRYRIAKSGGLGGAQKMVANVASAVNTQNAKAKALSDIQQQRNAHKMALSQMEAGIGQQEAAARMQAAQWDLDYYSKAHAARQQGMQMGLYNSLNALQQYIANANKLYQWQGMRDLYAAGVAIDKYKAERGNYS